MSKPDFGAMTRSQFRQYILEHREDDEAFSIYVERFKNPDAKVYPPPKSLDDPEIDIILREHLEQRHNPA
jgi:hypothetical protein